MRTRVKAKDLRAGMLAFLPYYGRLRKAKIVAVAGPFSGKSFESVRVDYQLVHNSGENNSCLINVDSQYEVYVRPVRANGLSDERRH